MRQRAVEAAFGESMARIGCALFFVLAFCSGAAQGAGLALVPASALFAYSRALDVTDMVSGGLSMQDKRIASRPLLSAR